LPFAWLFSCGTTNPIRREFGAVCYREDDVKSCLLRDCADERLPLRFESLGEVSAGLAPPIELPGAIYQVTSCGDRPEAIFVGDMGD
jgi:hypothetical protein